MDRKSDRPPEDSDAALPGSYVLQLVDLCRRFGVEPDVVLSGTGHSTATLADPSVRVPLDQVVTIGRSAIALTGEPGLAFEMALQMKLSWHGFVGFAAMAAPTLREAILLAERFAATRTAAVHLTLVEQPEERRASLTLALRAALPRDAREFLVVAILVGVLHLAETLVAKSLRAEIDFDFSEPPHAQRFAPSTGATLRFGRPSNRIVIDTADLDTRVGSADAAALLLARRQCETELARLALSGAFVEAVRRLARANEGSVPSIEDVARQLHVAPRTLRRRLAGQGVTFKELLDAARREESFVLLLDPRVTVDDVAARLGYSESANFARAFRRWTGLTPAAWRAERRK